jgi:signal peptidase I
VAAAEKSRWRQNVESIAGPADRAGGALGGRPLGAVGLDTPAIQIGDHIFVNKLAYSVRVPLIGTELLKVGDLQRDDVVVFVSPIDPSTDLIKRVVAVPGDTVEIRSKQLYVNGEKVSDPHAHFTDSTIARRPRQHAPTRFGGKFFVMGAAGPSFKQPLWGCNIGNIKARRPSSTGRGRFPGLVGHAAFRTLQPHFVAKHHPRRTRHGASRRAQARAIAAPTSSGRSGSARGLERSRVMAGGKTFKRDQKRRKEMARKLKQEEKMRKRLARKDEKKTIDDLVEEPAVDQPGKLE